MVLAFILVVYIDGSPHDIGGVAAFRDIYRCSQFAKAIEQSANERWTSKRVYHIDKIDAWCEPKFVEKETKFWD